MTRRCLFWEVSSFSPGTFYTRRQIGQEGRKRRKRKGGDEKEVEEFQNTLFWMF